MNRNTKVYRAMTRQPITIQLNETVDKVRWVFDHHNIRHLPVVDEEGILKGIISKEDFFEMAYGISRQTSGKIFSRKWYGGIKAKEIMTECPIDLSPEDTIGLAADIFMSNNFHSLPITEDGLLIGIVTTQDLIRFAFEGADKTILQNKK